MKLRGIEIKAGDLIPAGRLAPRKHKQLWMIRKADHEPPKRKGPVVVEVAADGRTEDTVTVQVTHGPTVSVPATEQEPPMMPTDIDIDRLSPEALAALEAATAPPAVPLLVPTAQVVTEASHAAVTTVSRPGGQRPGKRHDRR